MHLFQKEIISHLVACAVSRQGGCKKRQGTLDVPLFSKQEPLFPNKLGGRGVLDEESHSTDNSYSLLACSTLPSHLQMCRQSLTCPNKISPNPVNPFPMRFRPTV